MSILSWTNLFPKKEINVREHNNTGYTGAVSLRSSCLLIEEHRLSELPRVGRKKDRMQEANFDWAVDF